MTTATQAVRDKSFEPLHCDIPNELTIAQYRQRRRAAAAKRRSTRRPKRPSLLRR